MIDLLEGSFVLSNPSFISVKQLFTQHSCKTSSRTQPHYRHNTNIPNIQTIDTQQDVAINEIARQYVQSSCRLTQSKPPISNININTNK